MPEDLRQQIYKKEEQSERRKQTNNTILFFEMLSIQIINVLSSNESVQAKAALKSEMSSVEVSDLRDENVKNYFDWQQSQVRKPSLKTAFQKVTDFVIDRGLDLELLHEDQNPQFLVEEAEIPIDIARRYYQDIKSFAKHRKLDHHATFTQQKHLSTKHDSTHWAFCHHSCTSALREIGLDSYENI